MTIPQQQARLRHLLERRGITDGRVLGAIEQTRRDRFVPESLFHLAYADDALPIGSGQTISQPYMVAVMTQELNLDGDETVLEIGTGSGYQAAILSQLCRRVITVERIGELATTAQEILDDIGVSNVEFHDADGTLGWPRQAPYEAIIVTAAAPEVPAPLYEQLTLGGRLVMPVGPEGIQELVVLEKQEPKPKTRTVCGCRFVKLIGKAGWPEA